MANPISHVIPKSRLLWKGAAAALVVFLFALAMPCAARAQFTGPALGASPQANQPQTPTTDPLLLNPGVSDLLIAPGDLLAIRVFGAPEFAPIVRVTTDGVVQLPLIGIVPIGGLTINRAEDVIAERLVNAGMYKNPQVSVQVSEASGQFVTVSGELHSIVPLNGSRRLLDVLAAAGSLPATASHVITVLRPGVEKPIVVDLGTDPLRSGEANIAIFPRDTIIISRVGVVYILGAFKTQGVIPLQQNSPLTLIQAAALSGGADFKGKYNDLRIIRTVGLERKLVKVDYKRILNGQTPDPVLQADDIVFLPSDSLKAAISSGGIATLFSVVSLLLVAFPR